jgi:hypothetical protein
MTEEQIAFKKATKKMVGFATRKWLPLQQKNGCFEKKSSLKQNRCLF